MTYKVVIDGSLITETWDMVYAIESHNALVEQYKASEKKRDIQFIITK